MSEVRKKVYVRGPDAVTVRQGKEKEEKKDPGTFILQFLTLESGTKKINKENGLCEKDTQDKRCKEKEN